MKTLVIILLALSLVSPPLAVAVDQHYNPWTRKWETVPDNYRLRYESNSRTWSYRDPNATRIYNPHERTWDWTVDDSCDKDEKKK